jgi:hypothetical protein
VATLVQFTRTGNSIQQLLAAEELLALAASGEAHRDELRASGAAPSLVRLLRAESEIVREVAAAAVHGLSSSEADAAAIGRAGGVRRLLALVGEGTAVQKEHAAAALANLALYPRSKAAIAEADDGLERLVALVAAVRCRPSSSAPSHCRYHRHCLCSRSC